MTTTTYLAVQHAGDNITDAGPYAVVRVTRTTEHVAGPFRTWAAAEKYIAARDAEEETVAP